MNVIGGLLQRRRRTLQPSLADNQTARDAADVFARIRIGGTGQLQEVALQGGVALSWKEEDKELALILDQTSKHDVELLSSKLLLLVSITNGHFTAEVLMNWQSINNDNDNLLRRLWRRLQMDKLRDLRQQVQMFCGGDGGDVLMGKNNSLVSYK